MGAGAGGAKRAEVSEGGDDPCDVYDTGTLVRRFVELTLPKAAWTHKAHLRAGLWHVREHGGRAALSLLRTRIRRYNEAVGTPNTADSGYHETVTRLYVRLIEEFLRREPAPYAADSYLPDLERRLVAAIGDRALPLKHYSRDRLFTPFARQHWVEPDLQPLPRRRPPATPRARPPARARPSQPR
jgi:hypothetical protein